MTESLLFTTFILLAAALLVVPVAKFTGLGAVLGYLLAGIVIGPYGLEFFTETETIQHFSEFGVVMMLFLIGLEIHPKHLWHMRHQLLGLGFLQVIVTTISIMFIAILAGQNWAIGIIIGMGLSLSSTAIVLQILEEKNLMRTTAGRSGFSILLFQDIAIIPMLTIIPLLVPFIDLIGFDGLLKLQEVGKETAGHSAGHGSSDPGYIQFLKIIIVFIGMILGGRFLLDKVFRIVAASNVREIFTALALAIVVGAALLMEWIGLSPALGAFMGGVMLADSEYRHQLEADIGPFKGILLGLFFISVGMSIDFQVISYNPLLITTIVAVLIILKFLIILGIARLFKLHKSQSLFLALLLAQGGEFSFVLFQFAYSQAALTKDIYAILNASVAISMVLTPLLLLVHDRYIQPIFKRLGSKEKPEIDMNIDDDNSVIVAGFGRFGQIIARVLHTQGFDTTVLDHDPDHIEFVRKFGYKVFYGDAGRLDLLEAAGARKAKMLIICVDERDRITEITKLARENFPHLTILARAMDRQHYFELLQAGADNAVRETFYSALWFARKALSKMGYNNHQAWRVSEKFAYHDRKVLQKQFMVWEDEEALLELSHSTQEDLDHIFKQDEISQQDEDDFQEWETDIKS